MENLGTATPKVELLSKLPYVQPFVTKINFDANAHNWQSLSNSPYFAPLLCEQVADPAGTFAAIMPSMRIYWINNYLANGTALSSSVESTNSGTAVFDAVESPYIKWTQINKADVVKPSIMTNIIPNFNQYSNLVDPADYATGGAEGEDAIDLTTYKGPLWVDNSQNREPPPDDATQIQEFLAWVGGDDEEEEEEATEEEEEEEEAEEEIEEAVTPVRDINFIYMSKVEDGLWWGLQSNAFLEENMPFWITLNRMQPPTSADHDTVFVVSLGLSDKNHRFDIYLSLNNKPRIVDWIGGSASSGVPQIQKEFEAEGSRIWSTDSTHRIGIMTIAGRLVVLVDGHPLVYSRIDRDEGDNGGKLLECKIAPGPINIYGTNSKAAINISPMTFADFGALSLAVPIIAGDSGPGQTASRFEGVDETGAPSDSVCHLPTPYGRQRFGCDCFSFTGDGGEAQPTGFGFHRLGTIKFAKANEATFKALPSSEFYTVQFRPSDTTFLGETLPNGGAPYYFRLKGIALKDEGEADGGVDADITNTVFTINETATAPDYFHVKKSLDLVCYDEGGSLSQALVANQSGIRVSWGWNGEENRTFTGVVTSVSTSQKAGMETVSIRAEDYSFILKSSPIINSPFYDGMVALYALKDMADRACLTGIVDKWQRKQDYFLPSGYAFSKPKVRYNGSQMIFDCMMDIAKRFEAFIYFDKEGRLTVEKLPGGLFSEPTSIAARFVSDPTGDDPSLVILDEKKVDVDYSSIVNVISAMTLERDTRNAVIYAKTASGDENNLLFKKPYLYNQAALGELEVCRNYVEDLSQRLFYPSLKTNWQTAGTQYLTPLEFVTILGQPFRLMSIKRSYNSEANDLTTSYEGEWLGGAKQ